MKGISCLPVKKFYLERKRTMEKLKIAIIGVGGISGAHIDAYQRNPHAALYAF